MSHMSMNDAEDVYRTPHPRNRVNRVKDFLHDPNDPKSTRKTPAPDPRIRTILPFTTPVARRLMATDLVAEMEEDENLEALSHFENLTWKTYSVSPLFGYDKVSSPDYIQICLRKQLEKYEVTVETVKGLRGNREDEDCLKIFAKNGTTVCSIYFTAIHSQECEIKSKHGLLPLALANGPEELIQSIFRKVERLFDCIINPIRLDPTDLKWMTALWAEHTVDDEKKDSIFKLRYKISGFQSQAIQNIDVKFEGEQMRGLWHTVKDNDDNDLTAEDMETFHNVLYGYLHETYGIDFQKCLLTNICLPVLSAASTGYIKVHKVDKIKSVLGFMTSLSQEKFITKANPGLGVPLNSM